MLEIVLNYTTLRLKDGPPSPNLTFLRFKVAWRRAALKKAKVTL
jgi:hypothetical protein